MENLLQNFLDNQNFVDLDPNIMEWHVVFASPNVHYQLIYLPGPRKISASQVLHNNNNHRNCDHHFVFMSVNDHVNGASLAPVLSATLRIPLGDVYMSQILIWLLFLLFLVMGKL